MNLSAAPAATTSADDAELVDAVRAGEDQAFEELFRRYRPRVYAFVQRRVRDEGRAEDLTQEAFLSALRRLRETDSEVAFRPWIYEIARNATIDQFRRNARAGEVSMENVESLPASDHLRLVGDPGPDRQVEAKQQIETLQGAFAELSDRHERILVMREFEGRSYREIAERMELTRPGVESTLFRARRRLEHEFAELETGRRCLTVRGAMGRLAEGLDLRGDRGKVSRHVRRCTACRATARELGLVPDRPSRAARVAAVLPLPAFLVRRLSESSAAGAELAGVIGVKGTALVAALALATGGAGLGTLTVPHSLDHGASEDAPVALLRAELGAPAVSAAASAATPPAAGEQSPTEAQVELSTPAPSGGLTALSAGVLERLGSFPEVRPQARPLQIPEATERPVIPGGLPDLAPASLLDNEAPATGGIPPEDGSLPTFAAPVTEVPAPAIPSPESPPASPESPPATAEPPPAVPEPPAPLGSPDDAPAAP